MSVKIFCVGGAVRDILLERKVSDQDYLLVGADSDELFDMGLIPVGRDFPVFLHPFSKQEIALARTEKKKGKGYKGFQFNASKLVTLEEDLKRRDFTVNALAIDEEGNLFDYFSGLKDLKLKLFRHIGPEFSDDPLRLIRLARFLAAYPDFSVHFSTQKLCNEIVTAGEIKTLSKERIWTEFSKGLLSQKPSKMVDFLEETHAWNDITSVKNVSYDTKNKIDFLSKSNESLFWMAALLFLNCDNSKVHCLIPNKVISCKKIILDYDFLSKKIEKFKDDNTKLSVIILDFVERSDLFRKSHYKVPLMKIMFYKNEKMKKYYKIFSKIFDSVLDASVREIAKNALEKNLSIKKEIRSFRLKLILDILEKNL